jgi:hypothetical protein
MEGHLFVVRRTVISRGSASIEKIEHFGFVLPVAQPKVAY